MLRTDPDARPRYDFNTKKQLFQQFLISSDTTCSNCWQC